MAEPVYKKIEITGTSKVSQDEAVRSAISRSSKTVQNMKWFEVVDARGTIEDGAVSMWQVTIKIGFTLNE